MGSRLTIRVGKIGARGTVEFGKARVVEVKPGPTRGARAVPENPGAYPPCRCPLHHPDLHPSAAGWRR